jgi:phosphopantothenoylcysteine decarboxylase/phosphopantothenate--cysteine ligase
MNLHSLAGKRILLTAGATRESLDPFRYFSTQSTSRLGFAIAEEFLQQGAEVFLISADGRRFMQHPSLTLVRVTTASEMYLACCRFFEQADVGVFAAAVSAYRPARAAEEKIHFNDPSFNIRMVRNIDIAAEFGKVKTASQLSVGFALESTNELRNAELKLMKKNFDLVVLHSITDEQEQQNNKVTIIKHDLSRTSYPQKSLNEIAEDIAFEIGIALSHAELAEWEEKEQAYEMLYR